MLIVLTAVGSALGGVARHCISLAIGTSTGFPVATFVINTAGSLLIGLVSGSLTHIGSHTEAIQAFAVVGLCGGFTTFSTFSNDSFRMVENGEWGILSAYVFGSILAGFAAVWIGYLVSR